MRWLAPIFLVTLFVATPTARALPVQPDDLELQLELDATWIVELAIPEIELPRLVAPATPRASRSILHNPFMHALFKGVRVPGLDTARAQVRLPDERVAMLALRPRGAGGVLRFRVRFDSGLYDNTGPLRRFLSLRRSDL